MSCNKPAVMLTREGRAYCDAHEYLAGFYLMRKQPKGEEP